MFRLIIKEYKDNYIRALIMFVIAFAVAVTSMVVLAQRKMIYSSVEIFRAYGLQNSVIIYDDELAEEEELSARLNSIRKLDAVEKAEFCDYASLQYCVLFDKSINSPNGKGNAFDLVKMPKLEFNPFIMVEGRPPENDNEIMISSNIKKITSQSVDVEIGVELKGLVVDAFVEGEHTQLTIPSVRITGIFDLSNPVPLSLNKTFQSNDWSTEGLYDWVDEMYGNAFFIDIKDSEGRSIPSYFPSCTYLITPADGYDTADVIRILKNEIGVIGYDLEGFKEYEELCHADEVLKYKSMSITLFTLIITMNISYLFISLSINRKTMAIYYVCGLPWGKVISLKSFSLYIFVLLGYSTGVITYAGQGDIIQHLSNNIYLFSQNDAILVGVIISACYLSVNVLFYYYTKKKDPIHLLREEL